MPARFCAGAFLCWRVFVLARFCAGALLCQRVFLARVSAGAYVRWRVFVCWGVFLPAPCSAGAFFCRRVYQLKRLSGKAFLWRVFVCFVLLARFLLGRLSAGAFVLLLRLTAGACFILLAFVCCWRASSLGACCSLLLVCADSVFVLATLLNIDWRGVLVGVVGAFICLVCICRLVLLPVH